MITSSDRRAWPPNNNHIPCKKKSVPKKTKRLHDIPLFDARHSKSHAMTPSPSPAEEHGGGSRLPQQYCLKWNNHNSNISGVFDRLRYVMQRPLFGVASLLILTLRIKFSLD